MTGINACAINVPTWTICIFIHYTVNSLKKMFLWVTKSKQEFSKQATELWGYEVHFYSLLSNELLDGLDDVVGRNAVHVHEHAPGAAAGDAGHSQATHVELEAGVVTQHSCHCLTKTTWGGGGGGGEHNHIMSI